MRFAVICVLALASFASCQQVINPTTTIKPEDPVPDPTDKPVDPVQSTTVKPVDPVTQPPTQPPNADTTKSPDPVTTTQSTSSSSTTTSAPITTTNAPSPKDSTEMCKQKYAKDHPDGIIRAVQDFPGTCQAKCALVKNENFFIFFQWEIIKSLGRSFPMMDGEKCDDRKQCLSSKCVSKTDVDACKAKSKESLKSMRDMECQLQCNYQEGSAIKISKSGLCGYFGKCKEGKCRFAVFKK